MVSTDALRAMQARSPLAGRYIEQAADCDNVGMTDMVKRYQRVVDGIHDCFIDGLKTDRTDLLVDFDAGCSELARLSGV